MPKSAAKRKPTTRLPTRTNNVGKRIFNGPISTYKPEYAAIAAQAFSSGATDTEVADIIGVSEGTIRNWAFAYPQFSASLKVGKGIADDRVEAALFRRAVGFRYAAQKAVVVDKRAQIIDYTEYLPPDPTSCIFWLKNRRKDIWRDRHDVAHGLTAPLEALGADDLATLVRMLREEERANMVDVTPTHATSDATSNAKALTKQGDTAD
jgi:hypothetical protein